MNDAEYLKLAKEAYEQSTSYFDSNYRSRIDDAIRMFHSQHPRSSKYNSDAYRYRSRLFRPKSRSVVRKHEATAARAFFSNLDVVSVSPQDGSDPKQIASATINKELLQYRLTKTIPWFVTLVGAFQDAMKSGVVCSFQYWEYQSRMVDEEVEGLDEDGNTVIFTRQKEEVVKDQPCVEIFPIERLRFSPAAKWFNVVETSPYIILQMPMHVYQVKERARSSDYGPRWREVTESELRGALLQDEQSTEQARRSGANAPTGQSSPPLSEYDIVDVHLNFVDTPEGRKVFYTLKDRKLLSDPVPLEEMFFHGRMPITVGFCVLDSHNPMPEGIIDLGKNLQTETNEIANQRIDNVKLVLNKRWLVKRNQNVDVESLMRNVPGGVTMVGNTATDGGDIREVNWHDVTSSSYQEQDRINVDYDDLTGGGINSASVMSNRSLNETVGGMRMMAQGANDLTEYTIRTFVETWVEPVLRQVMLMEQHYESDETILAIAGKKAGLYQRFGMDEMTDNLLMQELTLTVNVGMGATDPQDRLQKFLLANNSWLQMAPMLPADANIEEIRTELFGLAGYRDAARFYTGRADPRVATIQQQMQQLMQQLQQFQIKEMDGSQDRASKEKIAWMNNQTKLLVAQSGGENPQFRMEELNIERMKADREFALRHDEQEKRIALEAARIGQDLELRREDMKRTHARNDQVSQQDLALKREMSMQQAKDKKEERMAAAESKKTEEKKPEPKQESKSGAGEAAIAAAITSLSAVLSQMQKPKTIVRGKDGRAERIE